MTAYMAGWPLVVKRDNKTYIINFQQNQAITLQDVEILSHKRVLAYCTTNIYFTDLQQKYCQID